MSTEADARAIGRKGRAGVRHGREAARREAHDPPAIAIFLISYVLLSSGRLVAHAQPVWWDRIRPAWALPSPVEGLVWAAMYAVLGVCTVLTLRHPGGTDRGRMVFWLRVAHLLILQLSVYLLFGTHLVALAGLAAFALVILGVALSATARPVSPLASKLYAGYTVWLAYNAAIVMDLWLGR